MAEIEKQGLLFNYQGIKNGDEKTKGLTVGESEAEVIKMLEKKGIFVTKISVTHPFILKFQKAKPLEIALFFNGLSKMLDAGLGIETALDLMMKETSNPNITMFLFNLKKNINEGNNLPDAVKKTDFFPRDIVEMIRVGNESGKIIEVFINLKDFYEQQHKINKAIKSATIMPIVMVVTVMLIIVFLAPKMITPMMAIFDKIDPSKFPKFTTYTMVFVNFVVHWIVVIILLIMGLVAAIKWNYKNKPVFKYKTDYILLKLPIIGGFIEKLAIYKFFMSLSILYDAGIPINNAFDMIAKSQSNDLIKNDFTNVKDLMNKGYNLTKSIQKSPFISDLAKSLINIGEETGKLSEQLRNLKDNSKADFEEYTETIKKAMTPISTIVIGGCVGALVVAVYLPIMSMVDLMKG